MSTQRPFGFTVAEALTALVALVVVAAVAVPMWRTHELRMRREDAIAALLAVQTAQDQYFGKFARYANAIELDATPPQGLGIKPLSKRGFYAIAVRNSADNLGYLATARVKPLDGNNPDTRCVEMRIDQNGRRFAADADGVDRSADCWRAD